MTNKNASIITGYLNYNSKIIEYKINRGKRKRVYLHIENGELEVRVPSKISNKEIENIVKEKAKWIYESLKKFPKVEITKIKYETGDIFHVLGEKYQLKVREGKNNTVKKDDTNKEIIICIKKNYFNDLEKRKKKVKKLISEYYSKLAETEISFSMEKIIRKTGLVPNAFKVRNFKRAWGNCSSKKIISINGEVIMYSRQAIDYVCLHEICHLKHMNHSKEFWKCVSQYMPDYKLAEKELKEKIKIEDMM